MKKSLMILALALALGACGQPSATDAETTIRAYADTVQLGDVTKARTLISNPSIDWSESAQTLVRYQVQSYTLREQTTTAIGHEATVVWQTAQGKYPFCSYVRVRTDDGRLEMRKDTTHFCPEAFAEPATP